MMQKYIITTPEGENLLHTASDDRLQSIQKFVGGETPERVLRKWEAKLSLGFHVKLVNIGITEID
jgi:hypothetical protein